jgi:two-component system sensor histidine kinase SenX3
VTALVAALLVAWFATGWREVRARQREVRGEPAAQAEARAGELARDLRGRLESLIARESGRPYFQYQNLFHDPRASAGWNVAPSPIAGLPEEPLVLGYFQIDAHARVTTPTVNDEVPELSEPTRLAEHRAFRDEVARVLVGPLREERAVVASAGQVQSIDFGSYAQNTVANDVYRQRAEVAHENGNVAIVVAPLAWRTLAFAGAPALVAVRRVDTPDGPLAQGFVVDRAALTSALAGRAGDLVAELHAGGAGAEIAAGWTLTVAPNPHAVARAFDAAASVAREFVFRFVAIALAAALAAAFVVLLVARAEKLARERSQFAAAAAHELRTPLAGLQLYGDMLAGGLGDPDKVKDYARRMSEEAARLGRVVSNVLGFSQLERGTLGVDAQVGPIGEALRELAERAEPALDRAGAALALDVSPDLRARFDRDALARVVANLLDNAEKYGRGGADRTIDLAARDRGDHVEIEVTDRGPGVTDTRALFEPFARGAGPDAPPGLGLGLPLSRSLARAMGGDLEHRGGAPGATFVLTLPRA